MALITTITATTSDEELDGIRFLDMRQEARERRDDAAAVIDEQGDQEVLELHEIDGVTVLYSPTFGYALVNEYSNDVGDSLVIDNGEAESPSAAAQAWKGLIHADTLAFTGGLKPTI